MARAKLTGGFRVVLLGALLLVTVGCADSAKQEPTATPLPTATPGVVSGLPSDPPVYGSSLDIHFGAATASLEERVYMADVVVRATLGSAANDVLSFRVVSYLKGSGPTDFTVRATTEGRDTQWDDQDAILFLLELTGEQQDFEFVDTTSWDYMTRENEYAPTEYTGDLPAGYTLGRNNPVWLPVRSAPAEGATGQSDSSALITADVERSVGAPEVTLQELATTIRWLGGPTGQAVGGASGSANAAEYQDCVVSSLRTIRNARDVEAYTGRDFAPGVGLGATIGSGEPAGAVVFDHSRAVDQVYITYEVAGPDARLFATSFRDDDEQPITGYEHKITTARPLPAGSYVLHTRARPPWLAPCAFRHPDFHVVHQIEVLGDYETHEAFFDPATTTAGVGHFTGATTTGVLSPAAFSTGSATTTITGLKWQSGSVVLSLSPFVSLGDYQLSFIDLDGSFALALGASDATADSAAGTLTWAVADKPWSAGDLLMLRIGPGPDSAPAPQGVSVSLSDSIFTISWSVVDGASLYRAQRRTGGAGDWTSLPAATNTSHTFSPQGGVACGATYQFRAQAHGDGHIHFAEWGAPSEVVSHTTGMCDLPPVFRTSTYAFSVPEDAATNTVVGTVSATDPNGDAVSYSITSGNDDGAFSMDGSGGSISVAIPLDYETTASYTLTVQAADRNGSTATSTVEIAVTDVAETPPAPQGVSLALSDDTFTISWSAVADASRYRVQRRTGGTGEWTSLPPSTNTSRTFSPQGGVACGATYKFRVQARGDGHTHFAEWGAPSEVVSHTTRTCNLPPVFRTSAYAFSVAENSSVWTVVGTVLATDPDPGDTVTYRITSGNEGGKFRIRSRHYRGQILVRRPLDYERVSSYKLTVEARDGNQNGTARATVKIGVINVAD